MSENWVCIGQFSDPFGVKGEVRLKVFTQMPEGIQAYQNLFLGPEYTPVKVTPGRQLKDGVLAKVEGFETPEAAKGLKGRKLFVRHEHLLPLQEGEFYHADLVGLVVKAKNGNVLGRLTAIHDFGAGTVIEITLVKPAKGVGQALMLPFRGEVVLDIGLEAGEIIVDADGWLEEENT